MHYAEVSPAIPQTLCGAKAHNVTNRVIEVTCKKCKSELIRKYLTINPCQTQ